jgi:hypothetical protein
MLSLVTQAKIVTPLKDATTKKNPVVALAKQGTNYVISASAPDDSADNQVWNVELSVSVTAAGVIRLQYQFSMTVGDDELALAAGPAKQAVPVVAYKQGDPDQLWTAVNIWDSGHRLRFGFFKTSEDQAPDRVLDLKNAETANGTPVLLWPPNSPPSADIRNQQWSLQEVPFPGDDDDNGTGPASVTTFPEGSKVNTEGKYDVYVNNNKLSTMRLAKDSHFPSLTWR